MADAPTNKWQEKYLNLLDEQEALEKASAEQTELLRRALMRVSLAADGQDGELDQVLAALRDHLKNQPTVSLENRLSVVDEALLAFESRRQTIQDNFKTSLQQIITHLRALDPSRQQKNKLQTLSKKSKQPIKSTQQFETLLQDLTDVHKDIFVESTAAEKKTWFKKFINKPDTKRDTDANAKKEDAESIAEDNELVSPNHRVLTGEIIRDSKDSTDGLSEQEAIAEKVATILKQLLDDIEPVACIEEKIQNTQERIKRGISWQDLAPTLIDLKDLLVQVQFYQREEFTQYLVSVDQELHEIIHLLGTAQASTTQNDVFHTNLESELIILDSKVANAKSLEEAKKTVADHINSVREALVHQKNGNTLTDQLKQLLHQVETLESDAKQAQTKLSEQQRKALTDSLTGLPNRAAYDQKVHEEFNRWKRYANPLCLAVIDIDHFKQVNDNYGHHAGDKVLALVGNRLSKRLREVDFVARYGGEEFVVILPETKCDDAQSVLNEVREAIAATRFHFKGSPVPITVSMGVTQFTDGDTLQRAFQRADKAMYQSKNNGRNQVNVL